MRLFKFIVALIVIGLIALFISQNMATWNSPIKFEFDLKLIQGIWNLELYLVLLVFALLGFFVGFGLLLKPYLRARKRISRERQERKQEAQSALVEESRSELDQQETQKV